MNRPFLLALVLFLAVVGIALMSDGNVAQAGHRGCACSGCYGCDCSCAGYCHGRFCHGRRRMHGCCGYDGCCNSCCNDCCDPCGDGCETGNGGEAAPAPAAPAPGASAGAPKAGSAARSHFASHRVKTRS